MPARRPISSAFLIVYALLIALGLGLGSAYWFLRDAPPFGEMQIGPWKAWPKLGSPEVDPYMRAIAARRGDVPLAAGEGLGLLANVDSEGRRLDSACTYRVGTVMPAARLWTLTLYDGSGRLLSSQLGRSGFTSSEILRKENGEFSIVLSHDLQPGNWLQLPASGSFNVVLRLYDPTGATASILTGGNFPAIERLGCGS